MKPESLLRRGIAAAMIAAGLIAAPGVEASSHREAPFISTQPQTDGTDFYLFRSYEPGREGYATLYFTLVTLHILATVTWIGDVLFIALVGTPTLRTMEPPSLRTALWETIGLRFRTVG